MTDLVFIPTWTSDRFPRVNRIFVYIRTSYCKRPDGSLFLVWSGINWPTVVYRLTASCMRSHPILSMERSVSGIVIQFCEFRFVSRTIDLWWMLSSYHNKWERFTDACPNVERTVQRIKTKYDRILSRQRSVFVCYIRLALSHGTWSVYLFKLENWLPTGRFV